MFRNIQDMQPLLEGEDDSSNSDEDASSSSSFEQPTSTLTADATGNGTQGVQSHYDISLPARHLVS